MAVAVRFTFSALYPSGAQNQLQHLGQTHDEFVATATLTYDGLRESERAFVNWFEREMPEWHLVEWTSGPADGDRQYSCYRAYL